MNFPALFWGLQSNFVPVSWARPSCVWRHHTTIHKEMVRTIVNKSIPATQLAKPPECLLERQHWLGASENTSVKVFAMWNWLYFTFKEYPTDLKCYFLQHVNILFCFKNTLDFLFLFIFTNIFIHYLDVCVFINSKRGIVRLIFWQ